MSRQRKIYEEKIYRLRNKDTGLFLSNMRDRKPTFSKRGKNWKSRKDVIDQLMSYNFNSLHEDLNGAPEMQKTWPELEIVVFQITEVAVEEDPICDMRHVKKFIRAVLPHDYHDYCSIARFVKKLAAVGTEFDYLIHAEGIHTLTAITDARIQRNPLTQYDSSTDEHLINGETIVAVSGDTDLLYAKMQLHESILGIWDYHKCKAI